MCIECAIAILIFKEFLYRFISLMGNDLVLNAAFIIKDAKIDVEIVYQFHRKIYSSKNNIFFSSNFQRPVNIPNAITTHYFLLSSFKCIFKKIVQEIAYSSTCILHKCLVFKVPQFFAKKLNCQSTCTCSSKSIKKFLGKFT